MHRARSNLIPGCHGSVRPLTRLTVDAALDAVPDLLSRYEQGYDWLERRVDDVAHGRAYAMGIGFGDRLIALALVAPKGFHGVKLSTFGVAPQFRSKGIGRVLLNALRCKWMADDTDRVHVTVDQDDFPTTRFFFRNSFAVSKGALVGYGERRWDKVLTWSPALDLLASAPFH